MKPLNVFPYDSNFNFIRLRWISLTVAALIMFVALGAMVFKGFNFALDFTGGTVTELRFAKPVDVDDVRSRLVQAGYDSPQVQTFGSGNDLLVRLQPKAGAGGQSRWRGRARSRSRCRPRSPSARRARRAPAAARDPSSRAPSRCRTCGSG